MRESAATAALLPAVFDGDVDARVALLELWAPTVLRWCARLGGPNVDEEDAAHDVFELVLGRVHALRAPEAFSSWLFLTTRSVVRQHRRRAWIRRWVPGLVPDVPDPGGGPGRTAEATDTSRKVQAVLETLSADLREVLVLCEIEERGGPEVAELLGVPLGTVKSRLRRARVSFEAAARTRGLAPESGRGESPTGNASAPSVRSSSEAAS